MSPLTRLSRTAAHLDKPPVRIVHLGLGAFHRAHQAWYTWSASDRAQWGIAAFTGRSPHAADVLSSQEGLYTLTQRAAHEDVTETVGSIVAAHSGHDLTALVDYFTRPELAIVTTTVTEAGYGLAADGTLDLSNRAMADDVARLAAGRRDVTTPVARIVVGLEARMTAGEGPLAVVPCDNVPGNGPWLRTGLLECAGALSVELVRWLEGNVSVVSTSVDRITPRPTEADSRFAAQHGWNDAAPVVTERFSDWVLSGEFPAGRPAWETVGATFVDAIDVYERRKLWLLNGAHTALASTGLRRGLATVDQAMRDSECAGLVERYWAEAAGVLPASAHAESYCAALRDRFANPALKHSLAQIATDACTKLGVRQGGVIAARDAAGIASDASWEAVRQWAHSVIEGVASDDSRAEEIRSTTDAPHPVSGLMRLAIPDIEPPALPSETAVSALPN